MPDAERQANRIQALAESGEMFAEASTDLKRLLALVARRFAELVGEAVNIRLIEGEMLVPVATYHRDPAINDVFRESHDKIPLRVELLRQVWQNLLENAVKYSRKRDVVRIEVDGELEAGEARYTVTDHGAGFDPAYADKLFGVFQRLHTDAEFEGTGVGLALLKRIVTRHGGRVWAKGEVGRGATFGFALPERGPPP